MTSVLRIGEVARQAGVSVDAIRFYERHGLLPRPLRRPSGYRQYSPAIVERIRFLKALQALGFTLGEVALVLGDVDKRVASCGRETPRFETVLARIDERIRELRAVRRELRATLPALSGWTLHVRRASDWHLTVTTIGARW